MLHKTARYSLVITGLLCTGLAIFAITKNQEHRENMATITHAQNPVETIEVDETSGHVRVIRSFEIAGAYPLNTMAMSRTETIAQSYINSLPEPIVVSVLFSTHGTAGEAPPPIEAVSCYITSRTCEVRVAPEDEPKAQSIMTVIYEGLVTGPISHDLDISTDSRLLVVDLDDEEVDADGRPRSIGAKAEGVNVQVGRGVWHVIENIHAKDWFKKKKKIEILTGTLNEDKWRPVITKGDGWPEATWLYLGAVFTPVSKHYYQLTHTFDLATETDPFAGQYLDPKLFQNKNHKYAWRIESKETYDADDGKGGTVKRIRKRFSDEILSTIYPIAGERNVISGRNLSTTTFLDLEL